MSAALFWFFERARQLEESEIRRLAEVADQAGRHALSTLQAELVTAQEGTLANMSNLQPALVLEHYLELPKYLQEEIERCITTLQHELSDAYFGLQTTNHAINFVSNLDAIKYRSSERSDRALSRENATRRIRNAYENLTRVVANFAEQPETEKQQRDLVLHIQEHLKRCINSFART